MPGAKAFTHVKRGSPSYFCLRAEGCQNRQVSFHHEEVSVCARSAEHARSTTLPEVLPHASPDQLPHHSHLKLRSPHRLAQGHLNWHWPYYLHSAPHIRIVSR